MSVDEVGGINEERRLMYVGITRAREKLYVTLASTRSTFGNINVAMPSRFLQEIPEALIEWRKSPGEATGRGGTDSRALKRHGEVVTAVPAVPEAMVRVMAHLVERSIRRSVSALVGACRAAQR